MRITGLEFGYDSRRIFEDFSFESDAPIVIFCGRTGCGKTTLLKLMCGFLKPKRVDEFSRASSARMVLQQDALFPWLKVSQNIQLTLPARNGLPRADEFLMRPISHLLDRPVAELSFGQRRFVELCRALMNAPPLLCLDEPFSSLDPTARAEAAHLIKSLAGKVRQIVMTTHHQDDVNLFEAPVFRFPETVPVTHLIQDNPEAEA